MRTFSYTGDSSRHRAFTLVELLAAMAIFVVMLTMVFAMLASAQKAWSAVDRNIRIYENARVLMDVITRDLQAAVASDSTGQEIPFCVFDPDSSDDKLAFVASAHAGDNAEARLCEIQYSHATSGAHSDVFRRSITPDHTSGGENADWNFYNFVDDPGGRETWWTDRENFHRVIEGVEDITFACYDDAGAMTNYAVSEDHLPSIVRVTFTLYDPNLADAPTVVRERTLRSFSKIIFLRSE